MRQEEQNMDATLAVPLEGLTDTMRENKEMTAIMQQSIAEYQSYLTKENERERKEDLEIEEAII